MGQFADIFNSIFNYVHQIAVQAQACAEKRSCFDKHQAEISRNLATFLLLDPVLYTLGIRTSLLLHVSNVSGENARLPSLSLLRFLLIERSGGRSGLPKNHLSASSFSDRPSSSLPFHLPQRQPSRRRRRSMVV